MRISELYSKMKGRRDTEPVSLKNKHFEYTVQVLVKDWTFLRVYYKNGVEVDPDSIPATTFAGMLQSDEWVESSTKQSVKKTKESK